MPKIVEDIASKELVPALDANMIAFRSVYGRANGCTLHVTSDVVWFYTGIPLPVFNGVLFAQLNPHEVKGTVDRLRAKILEQGAPALWWIGPLSKPTDLGSLLEEHGLHPASEVPGMAIELTGVENHVEIPPGFTIQKVITKEMQAVWARISDSAVDTMVQLEATLSDPQYQAQHRYLGLLDGMPVARSALALDAGVAGIYAVGTIPMARGKGIGRAMTVLPLLEARQLGYRVGILQASQMGYSLYQKLGFKDVCLYRLYVQSA
ncbi:MAG TPA: GNAT family N-acetyltransferase [Roseiflexaceae bacterium]|nr:GNAT family N-acetyltransferase [Roseiflexaceae bacterium]